MAFTDDKLWICVFEFQGSPHVIVARSAGSEATVRKHILQINPEMKITELRLAKDFADVEAVNARVRADPDWKPDFTNMDLAIKESGPVVPAA